LDNLTHTLLGVSLANAGLSRRFGRGTLLTLAVASNLPDVDAFWAFAGVGDSLLYRRMFTHSVLGIPLLAAIAAGVFRWRYRHIPYKALLGLCLLAMTVHVFFDLLNSYGVVLLYPFSLKRFELAWVFIIDLALWSLMLAPLILSCVRSRWTDLERLSKVSLACVGLYVAFCGFSRAQAANQLDQVAHQEGLTPEFSYVFPEALGPHRFKGVHKQGGVYRMYLLHTLTGQAELKGTFLTEEERPHIRAIRATKRAQELEWFFKAPVWRTVPGQKGEVEVFDLRFRSTILRRGKSPFVFRFKATSDGP